MIKSIPLKKGDKFNRLTVIKLDYVKQYVSLKGKKQYREYYRCKCDCGKEVTTFKGSLKGGFCKSCGCFKIESFARRNIKHNKTGCKLYSCLANMKQRCHDKKMSCYKYYGGRGITICDEWKDDFMSFYNWSIKNGYEEGLTIDRINNDGNYEPNNCRWATAKEQGRNQRSNHMLTYKGEIKCLKDWADTYNLSSQLVTSRINILGWSVERALTEPINRKIRIGD